MSFAFDRLLTVCFDVNIGSFFSATRWLTFLNAPRRKNCRIYRSERPLAVVLYGEIHQTFGDSRANAGRIVVNLRVRWSWDIHGAGTRVFPAGFTVGIAETSFFLAAKKVDCWPSADSLFPPLQMNWGHIVIQAAENIWNKPTKQKEDSASMWQAWQVSSISKCVFLNTLHMSSTMTYTWYEL